MGMRFRKSFGGKGFKVNVSKSGVGFSAGGKGLRYTKKAGGGTRTTASIPGTGVSYVKDSKKGKAAAAPAVGASKPFKAHKGLGIFLIICGAIITLLALLLALVEISIGLAFAAIGISCASIGINLITLARKHKTNKEE